MDYHNHQIAEIYDAANSLESDGEFYLSLAGPRPHSVLDLGCGTGTLCCAFAEHGHHVTGVDPAAAMLAVAKRKRHADKVEWVEAPAQDFRSPRRFDLIIMTGHAFQVLLTDSDALAVLETMRRHLNQQGRVVFESRNPGLDWANEWSERQHSIHLPSGEEFLERLEIAESGAEFISFRTSYRSPSMTLSTGSTLRFPARQHVVDLIARSGLIVRDIFGDWNGGPFDTTRSREMIFVAEIAHE